MRASLAAAAVLAVFMAQAAQAQEDFKAGEQVFKKCFPCHSIGEGAKNKVGPELNGLEGRHTGSVAGYNYSAANKNSGIVWDKEHFLKYIADPRGVIPGTKMIFPGIKNEKDAENLWSYLKQFDASGKKKGS